MKVRIEIFDDEGTKISIEFEGEHWREKLLQFIDALPLSGGGRDVHHPAQKFNFSDFEPLSVRERLEYYLRYEFPPIWFTSRDLKEAYERKYGEEIKLSTVSTYLARMCREGLVERRGNRASREYRYIHSSKESPHIELTERSQENR
ncbi:MAG: hypothetical protein PWR13_1283 [Archaeoglobi archaeon]|nr:hypothetical protein [Candidatus Mnemosynella bozhongmuii]MDI3502592.1 hypothetical protein [Archaeoglobi archaeon]MDK2782255.1 hypothetical protein [Archaeoglobi archaeon]